MASGAAFGIAAQISLQRLGLDFDRLCAAATRAISGGGQLMRGLVSFATAIAVLGIAAAAQLRSFPPATAVAANAVVSLLVVIGSAVLALLGARLLGGISHEKQTRQSRTLFGFVVLQNIKQRRFLGLRCRNSASAHRRKSELRRNAHHDLGLAVCDRDVG
jgi:hypothetical protein